MKHLQLSPPLLIMTMGYPGSGKTFFARQFSELYGLTRVSEDRLRYELFEKPAFNKEEAEIIERLQLYMVEEAMATEQVVLCEGLFLSFKQRSLFYDLAQKHGYRTLTIWLQTDLETSASRAVNRDRRNPDSKYSFPISDKLFSQIRTRLERPGEKETAIVISGKHAFKSQCLSILRKITSMYSESISKGEFTVKPATTKSITIDAPKTSTQRIIQ